jgi:hypothetical protein
MAPAELTDVAVAALENTQTNYSLGKQLQLSPARPDRSEMFLILPYSCVNVGWSGLVF